MGAQVKTDKTRKTDHQIGSDQNLSNIKFSASGTIAPDDFLAELAQLKREINDPSARANP